MAAEIEPSLHPYGEIGESRGRDRYEYRLAVLPAITRKDAAKLAMCAYTSGLLLKLTF